MTNRMQRALVGAGLSAAMALTALPLQAEDSPVQSTWKVQEIKYSYVGFTTAYDCDAAEVKIKHILTTVGAHPNTKVSATGCQFNGPSRNFFVNITAATPVPASEAKPSASDASKQELLKRLGTKNDISTDQFPATWKTVDLSKDRRLDLRPGDCELMEGLRDKVLPKLGIKVTEDRLGCTPNQLGITTPKLVVSALTAQASPDAKSTG
jgi:hypothetical protein